MFYQVSCFAKENKRAAPTITRIRRTELRMSIIAEDSSFKNNGGIITMFEKKTMRHNSKSVGITQSESRLAFT